MIKCAIVCGNGDISQGMQFTATEVKNDKLGESAVIVNRPTRVSLNYH